MSHKVHRSQSEITETGALLHNPFACKSMRNGLGFLDDGEPSRYIQTHLAWVGSGGDEVLVWRGGGFCEAIREHRHGRPVFK